MTLEEFIGKLNANVFLKEFSFSRNTFSPTPGRELELADQIVWLDNLLIAFQLKERTPIPDPTPESERKWFESKIQKKATKQIRDTLRYLEEHREIEIQNQRGHKFKIGASANSSVDKVVVYISGPKLPIECRRIKQYASDTAGFIHIIPAEDYLGICRTLLTPTEIHEYLTFREGLISRWPQEAETVSEQSLVGQFLAGTLDDTKPSEKNIQYLYSLNNSAEEFSLRRFMEVFAERIEKSTQENGYYFILSEIAKLNRTEAKAFKERFVLSLEDCKSKEVHIPTGYISRVQAVGSLLSLCRTRKSSSSAGLMPWQTLHSPQHMTPSPRSRLVLHLPETENTFSLNGALLKHHLTIVQKWKSACATTSPSGQ